MTAPFLCERKIQLARRLDAKLRGIVLLHAGYGNRTSLRAEITALGLTYVAGILSSSSMWASGTAPLPPKRWSGQGRPPTRVRRDAKHRPVSVKELALGLPKRAGPTIGWREGTAERLSSRFARVRVRAAAHRDEPHGEEWLLIEWPQGEKEPTKYWLSTLPHDIAFAHSSIWPSCAGASSAIIRSSNRNSAWAFMKVEDGAASTTTAPSASRFTGS